MWPIVYNLIVNVQLSNWDIRDYYIVDNNATFC